MMKHLSEREIDKLCKEEPDVTIKDYLELLKEIELIESVEKSKN